MTGNGKCRVCGGTEWIDNDLCSKCRAVIIAFVSIKGGVGRTNIVIQLAKCLSAAGKRVLLIDSDLNNSLGYHFLSEEMQEKATSGVNIATALSNENNNLCDYALPVFNAKNIDIIASTPYLADLRTLSEKRLKRMMPTVYEKYDIVIIDCPPTYDNIVLNAVNAADYTITPVLKDHFSYNAATYLSRTLPRDVDNFKNWFVLINGYDKRFEESKFSIQSDYISAYKDQGFALTPEATWPPWTTQIRHLTDRNKNLTRTKGIPGTVYNPGLYNAISELANCFFDDALSVPEVF